MSYIIGEGGGLMRNIFVFIQVGFVIVGGYIGSFLGGTDGFLCTLTMFVVIDYITGVMVAILQRQLNSDIGFQGIFKKVLIFILVGCAHMIDFYLIGDTNTVRTAVIFFYISNEGISILENAAKIGLPIPQKLKNILEQLKKEE